MLPPRHRLRHADDVARVRKQGRRWQHPLLILFISPQPAESWSSSRFAFAVGRRLGKAAQRNRVKRRLREIVRHHLEAIEPGRDCLFVARAPAATASYAELEQAVVDLLGRAHLLTPERAPVQEQPHSPS